MMLNKTQKVIILVAIFFVVAMILYPPWVRMFHFAGTNTTHPCEYAFIWLPPERARFIDLYRLSAQLFGVFVIAIGLCLVCHTKKH